MKPFKPRDSPEAKIQKALISFLQKKGWIVKVTHGNIYQQGLPDLYCIHENFGQRWIDVKNPKAYSFTRAQKDFWPEMIKCGVGVWILTAATKSEYEKLFKPPNLWKYDSPVFRNLR